MICFVFEMGDDSIERKTGDPKRMKLPAGIRSGEMGSQALWGAALRSRNVRDAVFPGALAGGCGVWMWEGVGVSI